MDIFGQDVAKVIFLSKLYSFYCIFYNMKKFLILLTLFIFIQSCDDVIDQSESSQYGAIKLTFNKPSEELTEDINNNRSMSQFADVDAVRITINNSSPVTVSIVGGSASYSKSGLSVGTAIIKVELTGAGITKYTQTKSVTIIADQTASASFNAFAITNQSISLTSSFQSTYDGGDIINLSWTNSHAEQPVNIERWDQVGGVWVKTKTVEEDFVGTSYSWDTQGEASGENVKIRIQSTISNSFIDSQSFQLLSTELILLYDQATFNDIIELQDGTILASGYLPNTSTGGGWEGFLLKFDLEGNILDHVTVATPQGLGFDHVVESYNGNIYTTSNDGDGSFTVYAFTQNLSYLSNLGTNGVATGIASYTSDGSNYLAISYHYQDASFGINPGIISIDVSSGNFYVESSWGWHQTSGDEFSMDVDVHDQTDIIISKYFPEGNASGQYFNYYGWKNFNPNTGSSSPYANGVYSSNIDVSILTDTDFTDFNADYTLASSGYAILALAALHSHVVVDENFSGSLNEIALDDYSSWAKDAFYDEDSSDYIIAGNSYFSSDHHAALYFYNDGGFTASYPDYVLNSGAYRSLFRSLTKIQESYVAGGHIIDNNARRKGLIYISNPSSKSAKSIIEIGKTSSTLSPKIEYVDVPRFNIE